jgi:hypothetical protein
MNKEKESAAKPAENNKYSKLRKAQLFCEGCVVVVVSRLPPPRFELQISRLPGKGGYSTRPPGTTK